MCIGFVSSARPNMDAQELSKRHHHLVTRATVLAASKGCVIGQVQGVYTGEPEQSISIMGSAHVVRDICELLASDYQQEAYAIYYPVDNTGDLYFNHGGDLYHLTYHAEDTKLTRDAPATGDYTHLPWLNTYLQMDFKEVE